MHIGRKTHFLKNKIEVKDKFEEREWGSTDEEKKEFEMGPTPMLKDFSCWLVVFSNILDVRGPCDVLVQVQSREEEKR